MDPIWSTATPRTKLFQELWSVLEAHPLDAAGRSVEADTPGEENTDKNNHRIEDLLALQRVVIHLTGDEKVKEYVSDFVETFEVVINPKDNGRRR